MHRIPHACFILLLLLGCAAKPQDRAGKLNVFVSILPQAAFVEAVGGEHVSAEVLVESGRSPATFDPSPKLLARLGEAAVYFRVGVPFEESFIAKVRSTYPDMKIVDTREGIELRDIEGHDDHDCTGCGGDHGGGKDPHVWLDPMWVKKQVDLICETLCEIDPGNEAAYRENAKAFKADLDEVHQKIETALAPVKGRELFVFHPAFGYFADRYGLRQVAVETGGKEPGPKQLAALIDAAKKADAKVIFVQSQFSKTSAQAVADAVGAAVVPMDPLARDYLANLERMADAVAGGLTR